LQPEDQTLGACDESVLRPAAQQRMPEPELDPVEREKRNRIQMANGSEPARCVRVEAGEQERRGQRDQVHADKRPRSRLEQGARCKGDSDDDIEKEKETIYGEQQDGNANRYACSVSSHDAAPFFWPG